MDHTPALVDRPKHRNQHPPEVTKAKQQRFLLALTLHGSHGQACQYADCVPSAPFTWALKNMDFAKKFEAAKEAGNKVLLSRYETNMDAVLMPETPMNTDDFARLQNSRFFRMKRLDPQYRDNAVVQVNAVGPVAIQLNFGASTQLTQAAEQAEDASDSTTT